MPSASDLVLVSEALPLRCGVVYWLLSPLDVGVVPLLANFSCTWLLLLLLLLPLLFTPSLPCPFRLFHLGL